QTLDVNLLLFAHFFLLSSGTWLSSNPGVLRLGHVRALTQGPDAPDSGQSCQTLPRCNLQPSSISGRRRLSTAAFSRSSSPLVSSSNWGSGSTTHSVHCCVDLSSYTITNSGKPDMSMYLCTWRR